MEPPDVVVPKPPPPKLSRTVGPNPDELAPEVEVDEEP
jgi:hypothetical protein